MLTKAEWTPLRVLSLRNTRPPSERLRTDSTQTVIGWKRSQSARVESRRKHVRILNKVYIVRVYPNCESSYTRVFHVSMAAASSFNAANSVTSQLRAHTPRRRNVLLTPARFQPGFAQTPVGVSNNALFTKSQWFTSQSIMQDNIDIDFSEFLDEKVSMNRIICRCTCQLRDGVTSGHSG